MNTVPSIDRECRGCGRAFGANLYHERYRAKSGIVPRWFCSRACEDASRHVTLTCARCSEPFDVICGHAHRRKYCSKECAGTKAEPVRLTCPTCRGGFVVPPREAKAGRRYCSQRCAAAGRSTSKSPAIRARFHKKGWERVRRAVIARDGGRCRMCGTEDRLHVHHVVPWSETMDDRPSNLVTLCSGCHMTAERAMQMHGEILCSNDAEVCH